ncbi:MAG: cytochrome ubiquinol oxidase subunit I [Bacteroidota bacterium]
MVDALLIDRLQFTFCVTYHYLFPQLTMGLALLIVIMKLVYLRSGDERFNIAAKFWGKIFAVNFFVGVITGIPMEFQFGTNWAKFSHLAGGVIGQTLAMEGIFSFFLESTFLGLFIFGEKRLGKTGHVLATILVFIGSWLSGYLIVATDAWMQHPVGYIIATDGTFQLSNFWMLFNNPWLSWQYIHTMTGSVITAAMVMASVGAYYLLAGRDIEYGKIFIRYGVISGLIATAVFAAFTGDRQAKNILDYQPVTLSAMEGVFHTKEGVELILMGQPDMDKLIIDNPVHVPKLLSFLTYYKWSAEIKGLDSFPKESWPDNIPLLYYSYHIMVGLGTIFIAILLLSALFLWRNRLFTSRAMLWILLLGFPFPYIANTAGWITAEVGRQPWLVYGLMRTSDGISPMVSGGNGLFTLLGFMGMYFVIGVLFLFIVIKKINDGPAMLESH